MIMLSTIILADTAVFDQAKADTLQEVQSRDSLTCEDLQKILVSHLTFIKDGHFNINQDYPSEKTFRFSSVR